MAFPNSLQMGKLMATGKVDDVEDEGMDEGRFFVHLKVPYSFYRDTPKRTKSFGGFREALNAVRTSHIVTDD